MVDALLIEWDWGRGRAWKRIRERERATVEWKKVLDDVVEDDEDEEMVRLRLVLDDCCTVRRAGDDRLGFGKARCRRDRERKGIGVDISVS